MAGAGKGEVAHGCLLGVVVSVVLGGIIVLGLSCSRTPRAEQQESYMQEGREAAMNGLPPGCCPYPADGHSRNDEKYEQWMRGWQQGAAERKELGEKKESRP